MHAWIDGHTHSRPRAAKRTRRNLWVSWVLSLAACHASPHVPAAGEPAAHALAHAAPMPSARGAGEPVQLSPRDLQLPAPSAEASIGERQFYAAATRAVRHVYEDDIDDPSQLLALSQRLDRDHNLVGARSVWQPVLATSLMRAQTLRTLGPTLRALRQALFSSWRDELTRSYRDVDQASCRIARAALPAEAIDPNAPLQATVVTIEPLGAYALRVFLRFCDDPRSLYGHE